jgi:hypothetical protein
MYGQLATSMITAVSRRPSAPDGDDGDNDPMWSLVLVVGALGCRVRCSFSRRVRTPHNRTPALAVLPPKRPTVVVAFVGCVAETRSNNEHITRSLDGLPSLVPFSTFATDISPLLQADITERVSLLRFANLAPTFSNRARRGLGAFVGIGNGYLHVGCAGPTRGPAVVTREVRRREMAAGEGTGMAGRPPLIGNRVPLIA